jgi:putative ATP-binding cassette transporter
MQTASAFGQVQDALSWFVNAYTQLADWKATVDRLTTFRNAMHHAQRESLADTGVAVRAEDRTDYAAKAAAIDLPGGKPLLAPFDVELKAGESVLVTGASGTGKSTLFRAFAGIWPFGRGTIAKPRGASVLFLPQKPYLTIGTLREQLCYPSPPGTYTDDELRAALADCRLGSLAGRLDEDQHWAQVLSGGEQQRVAFARALLQKPQWLFMDEATSALDEATESDLYRLLYERLPGAAVISIGHRASLRHLHTRRLEIRKEGEAPGHVVWAT